MLHDVNHPLSLTLKEKALLHCEVSAFFMSGLSVLALLSTPASLQCKRRLIPRGLPEALRHFSAPHHESLLGRTYVTVQQGPIDS